MQPRTLHFALASLALATGSVRAEADTDIAAAHKAECGDDRLVCLDRVQVTATRRPEDTLDVPAATTVVDAQQLREAAPQTVMDALHGAIGTFVQQTTPGQGVVIVRGLKGSEVMHLVDGFRLNNAIFRNAPTQYLALVDAQSVDRIEVVRGPSSTLYGGDAMGGVVQMLTPEPRFAGNEWKFGGRLRGFFTSADHALLGRAEFSAGRDGIAVSGGATWQDVDDLRVGGGERLHPTGFTARGGDLKLHAAVAAGHELVFNLQTMKQPRTPRFDALNPGFGQDEAENAVFFFEPQQRDFAHVTWRISRSTAWFDTAELHVGQQRIVDDRRTRAFGSRNEERERNRDRLSGVFGQFGKALGTHYLSYGFEAYRDEVVSRRTRTSLDSGATSTSTPRFPDGATMDSQALYVADDWLIGERVDLNFGARYSRFAIEIPASAGMPGVKLTPDDFTGNLGVSISLGEDWRFISNLGRGFRAPNVFDLGVFGPRPGRRFNVPNPDLKPETVISLDAGFKFGGEYLIGELIAFRSQYRDKITSVLTGGVQPGGALLVQNRNVTELTLWGVEAGARYLLPTPAVEMYVSATYTRGEERLGADRYPADRIPPLFGKLGARWQPHADLSLEGYALYATRQDHLSPRDMTDPRINPAGTAGWATLNARIGWQTSRDFALALRAENLADKRYREHGTGLDEPGRNLTLSADYRF